jgi:Fic family protein
MKLPVEPPKFDDLFKRVLAEPNGPERFAKLSLAGIGPAPGGKYRHWDTFRHFDSNDGLTVDERWLAVKLARKQLYQELPLKDAKGMPFRYALPGPALEMLHLIDRDASGSIQASDQVTNPQTRDTYLIKSLVEEAIASSQLEGASTTRQVAKEMLKTGREPRDRSERMILNNYNAMHFLRRFVGEDLTPSIVFELQKILTEGTLDTPDAAGRFRRADEPIQIEDEIGTVLHVPPGARELERRMERMCEFANARTFDRFIHPVVRAITLHFLLGYDHPFVDGNGRTARALFYWSMARQGYWLCEYISISRVLKKARSKYARSFLYTESDENDLTYFLLYQLKVILVAIRELHEYLARKQEELRRTEELLRRGTRLRFELTPRQLALLNHSLKKPDAVYTVESHRRSHNVSYETSRSDLLELVKRGLLTQSKRGRAFFFTPSADLNSRIAAAVDDT